MPLNSKTVMLTPYVLVTSPSTPDRVWWQRVAELNASERHGLARRSYNSFPDPSLTDVESVKILFFDRLAAGDLPPSIVGAKTGFADEQPASLLCVAFWLGMRSCSHFGSNRRLVVSACSLRCKRESWSVSNTAPSSSSS